MNVLKTMRNMEFLKILLWIVVISFLLAMFALWGGGLEYEKGHSLFGPDFAVKVGKESLSPGAYRLQYRFYTEQIRQMLGDNFRDDFLRGAAQRVADGMVDQLLLAELARKYGLEVSDRELAETIQRLYRFQDPQREYPETLQRLGVSAQEFEDFLRSDLLAQKVRDFLTETTVIPEDELKRRYVEENDKVDALVALVPSGKFLAAVPPPSEAELRALYEKKKASLQTPEKRAIEYVQVTEQAIRQAIKVDDAQLKAYYEAHAGEFGTAAGQRRASHILIRASEQDPPAKREEARKKAEEIARRAKAGEDFAKLASQYSEDGSNAKQGGDLGYFPRERMVPAFSAAVFDQLHAVGEIAGPVETPFGFHVVKLTGIGGQPRPFEEVKAQVRQTLLLKDPGYQKQAEALLEKARKDLEKAKSDAEIQAVAKAAGVDVVKIERPFSKKEPAGTLGRDPKVLEAIFKAEVGKWSGLLEVRNSPVRFKVTKVEPPHPATFEEVRADLEQEARNEKAFEQARSEALALKAAAKDAASLEEEAKRKGFSAQKSGPVNRKGSVPGVGFDGGLMEALFSARPGEIGGPVKTKFSYVVFVVTEKTPADLAAFEKTKDDYARQQRRQAASQFLDDYVDARKRELTEKKAILFNQDLIASLEPQSRS
ncbi:MAG: peptidyl-prolyl cis-trans isomerase [Acidobacteriota bacterium]